MGIMPAFGLLLAFVIGFALVFPQISALQDVSKPITSGALNSFIGTTTFIFLLVVVITGIGALAAAVLLVIRR